MSDYFATCPKGLEYLLRDELIAVISKYTKVDPKDITLSLDRKGDLEVLDVNVVLPEIEMRN